MAFNFGLDALERNQATPWDLLDPRDRPTASSLLRSYKGGGPDAASLLPQVRSAYQAGALKPGAFLDLGRKGAAKIDPILGMSGGPLFNAPQPDFRTSVGELGLQGDFNAQKYVDYLTTQKQLGTKNIIDYPTWLPGSVSERSGLFGFITPEIVKAIVMASGGAMLGAGLPYLLGAAGGAGAGGTAGLPAFSSEGLMAGTGLTEAAPFAAEGLMAGTGLTEIASNIGADLTGLSGYGESIPSSLLPSVAEGTGSNIIGTGVDAGLAGSLDAAAAVEPTVIQNLIGDTVSQGGGLTETIGGDLAKGGKFLGTELPADFGKKTIQDALTKTPGFLDKTLFEGGKMTYKDVVISAGVKAGFGLAEYFLSDNDTEGFQQATSDWSDLNKEQQDAFNKSFLENQEKYFNEIKEQNRLALERGDQSEAEYQKRLDAAIEAATPNTKAYTDLIQGLMSSLRQRAAQQAGDKAAEAGAGGGYAARLAGLSNADINQMTASYMAEVYKGFQIPTGGRRPQTAQFQTPMAVTPSPYQESFETSLIGAGYNPTTGRLLDAGTGWQDYLLQGGADLTEEVLTRRREEERLAFLKELGLFD